MQNGISVRINTDCTHVFCTFGTRFECSVGDYQTKFLHRSSGGGLSRLRCWLGVVGGVEEDFFFGGGGGGEGKVGLGKANNACCSKEGLLKEKNVDYLNLLGFLGSPPPPSRSW